MQVVEVRHLGLIDYKKAWEYQENLFDKTVAVKLANRELTDEDKTQTKNYLLFCEHPHVITLGKSGDETNLLLSEPMLKHHGISFYKINRGGDITYHGPKQLVGYPILDLDNFFTDIDKYLRLLEEVIILTLSDYGINGSRIKGSTGVWLDSEMPHRSRKICAMGIRCSRWVTMHGFALNVNNDLNYFDYIVPCGITGKQVTSLQKELGREVDMKEVEHKIMNYFKQIFGVEMVFAPSLELSN